MRIENIKNNIEFLKDLEKILEPYSEGIVYVNNDYKYQDYLKKLFEENEISKEDYVLLLNISENTPDIFLLNIQKKFAKQKPNKVFVKSESFSQRSYEEIKEILLEHEKVHLEDAYNGIDTNLGKIDYICAKKLQKDKLLELILEIRACSNFLNKTKQSYHDSKTYKENYLELQNSIIRLKRTKPKSEISRMFKDYFLRKYSEKVFS